jgi:4-carboxymuconolactone decarboxylase
MKRQLATLVLAAASVVVHAADRMPVLTQDQLTPDQAKLVKALLAGPRGGGGEVTPAVVANLMANGPFNAWARSPDLGDRLQKVGEYIRYGTSIPLRLNEFAILITARHWTSQYEWYAHLPLGLKAGLDPRIAAELAQNQRPVNMKEDEAAVYEFCTELHRNKNVSDATYAKAMALFGEKGVMDLIGVSGYYTAVSMTLNVAQVKLPPGQPDPLPPIK